MTKDIILKILENSKDNIMESFKIGEEEIKNIKDITDKRYENLVHAMESIFSSDLNNREKMVAYYLVGYATGVVNVLTTEDR